MQIMAILTISMKHTKRNQLHSWLKDCEPIMSYLSDVELEVLTQLMIERKLTKNKILLRGRDAAKEFLLLSEEALESYEYCDNV